MRDIPFFQTENGVASLILKEVAYKRIAYIRIQSVLQLDVFVKECVDFLRAVGAEKVFATGHKDLEKYSYYTSIVNMECKKEIIPVFNLQLVPVNEESFAYWRSIYNEKMYNVPNAVTITLQDAVSQIPGAYLIYDDNILLGIGKVTDNRINVIASVVKGAGRKLVAALAATIKNDFVSVEVATTNQPAVQLYASLGFSVTDKISDWYQVL